VKNNLNRDNKLLASRVVNLQEKVVNLEKEKSELLEKLGSSKAAKNDKMLKKLKLKISKLELDKAEIKSLLEKEIEKSSKLQEQDLLLKSSVTEKDLILEEKQKENDSIKTLLNEYEKYEKIFQDYKKESEAEKKKMEEEKIKLQETIESLNSRLKIAEESYQAEKNYWLKEIKENKDIQKKMKKKALIYKHKLKKIGEATLNIERIHDLGPMVNIDIEKQNAEDTKDNHEQVDALKHIQSNIEGKSNNEIKLNEKESIKYQETGKKEQTESNEGEFNTKEKDNGGKTKEHVTKSGLEIKVHDESKQFNLEETWPKERKSRSKSIDIKPEERFVRRSKSPPTKIRNPPCMRTGYRLIVENLSRGTSVQHLNTFMRQAGEILYVNIHTNGKGVVEFGSRSDMEYALDKLDGRILYGRKIMLTELNKHSGSRSRSRSGSRVVVFR